MRQINLNTHARHENCHYKCVITQLAKSTLRSKRSGKKNRPNHLLDTGVNSCPCEDNETLTIHIYNTYGAATPRGRGGDGGMSVFLTGQH